MQPERKREREGTQPYRWRRLQNEKGEERAAEEGKKEGRRIC
jgi:hypothetical protein